MKRLLIPMLALLLLIATVVPGAFAAWVYRGAPGAAQGELAGKVSTFTYGPFYITTVKVVGGSYASAEVKKSSDVNIRADLSLAANASSSVQVEVTFYNNTEASYYYNQTETVSTDNEGITYEVSGIAQKDEVPSKTFKTVTVTFSYKNGANVSRDLLSELHFNFVVDKSSIGTVVAQTAVGRFRDILNNVVAPNSYSVLETAMDNRSGFNKASAVTYIGNVAGSSSGDSATLNNLFGEEFMTMDLDGDGKAEPITMMVKRENLDNDTSTGDSYTYSTWRDDVTVSGVEMTLYITSQNLNNVNSGADVVVYAAVFTLLPGETEWIQITPLTKGVAEANNYGGWGNANSFNTDTWVSDDRKTIETLVAENMNK